MYIHISPAGLTPASVKKNTPPEKQSLGTISLKSTESGAGEQFMPQDSRAKAFITGMSLFTDTGINVTGPRVPVNHTPTSLGIAFKQY